MPTQQPSRLLPRKTQRYWALMAAACLGGCSPLGLGFLSPAGPVANVQRALFFQVIGLSLVVVLPVIVLTPWLVWHYRYAQKDAPYRPKWEFSLAMEIVSWGVPVLIVVLLGLLTWDRTQRLDPYRPLAQTSAPLEVQVVAMDWKWLFIYPQQGIASLNELVIPSGRQVHLSLTSATVMQSLLIARLSGQIYAMAGMRTQQYLQADANGQFLGRNTQFNGAGFQAQAFDTHAVSAQAFEEWVVQARSSDTSLDCAHYQLLNQPQLVREPQRYRDVQPGLFEWVINSFNASASADCSTAQHGGLHE
ncbi:MAG: cytochrome ubiquinol oxidase subunit [Pseudomonas sp.]|nr:cytochrome ubiquinol oxidase subunit [Pseudomonas sp.]